MTIEEYLGKNNTLGIDCWNKKYRIIDKDYTETFDEWLERVSGGYSPIKEDIIAKRFLFGGRINAHRNIASRGFKTTYSNCYVLPIEDDSIESIYKTASNIARTYSYGGGVGVDISILRPRGAIVHNSAKATTGAVSFMKTFDTVTSTIGQNGRRGALMLSISSEHPDLEEFINIKANTTEITSANISVRISDDFIKAVKTDSDYILRYPCDTNKELVNYVSDYLIEYNKLYHIGNEYYKKVKAKQLFDQLVYNNWNYAEPGILYWDNIKSHNFLQYDEKFNYAGVNPCAEEPLPAGGSCLLGSLNLSAFVTENGFDFNQLKKTVHNAVNALNQVLDEGLKLHPLTIQQNTVRDWRQIGLGIMGLADTLIKLKIKYGSEEAINFSDKVANFILNEAVFMSSSIAKTEGSYSMFDYNIVSKSDIFKLLDKNVQNQVKKYGLRNSQLLTIAPTGTISTMLNISGGIEPIFALEYFRTTKSLHGKDTKYAVRPIIVDEYMKKNNIEDIKNLPEYFVASDDILPIDRIKMQGTWQKYIDASISSTINLKETSTKEEIADIYLSAGEAGLKGVTVFRKGCAREAILSKTLQNDIESFKPKKPIERPNSLEADYYEVKIGNEFFIVLVGLLQNRPYEIFCYKLKGLRTNLGELKGDIIKNESMNYTFKSDTFVIDNLCNTDNTVEENATTLYISMLLRQYSDIDEIIKIAKKVDDNLISFTAAICRVLSKYIPKQIIGKCPECGKGNIIRENGCEHCDTCGWSKCG